MVVRGKWEEKERKPSCSVDAVWTFDAPTGPTPASHKNDIGQGHQILNLDACASEEFPATTLNIDRQGGKKVLRSI